MEPIDWLFLVVVITIMATTIISVVMGAAYRNGVVDGYGYSKEPNNPGYEAAGVILKSMSHRWPELEKPPAFPPCRHHSFE